MVTIEAWQSPVYCTCLENRRLRNGSVSSNLTASASQYRRGERDITRPCEGLSPRSTRGGDAKQYLSSVTAAYRSPKPLVGVQIPPGMPIFPSVG